MRFKKIITNPFFIAFLIGIASLHIFKQMAMARRHAPEPMVKVPEWHLIDQNAQIFGKKDLAGKIVIADFFFTSCPTICPKLTNAMKEVYLRFAGKEKDVHFLSITVDPQNDTPAVLSEFMKKNDLNFSNWHSLTGSKQEIFEVVTEKMRIHVGEREALGNNYDIPHLAQLALFDQNGDLRGLFKTDSVELAALVRAANFLLEESH